MFEDPELPDFDSMSQEELIAWLEQLAKGHSEPASEFIDHYTGDQDANKGGDDLQDAWSDWLDDTEPLTPLPDDGFTVAAEFEGDIPVDMTMLRDEDTSPTASMDWLDELTADAMGDDVPDFNKLRPEDRPPADLDEGLAARESDDPLEWLEPAPGDNPGHNNPHNSQEAGDDFDETYEDDEQLDDLEDESLYQSGAERSQEILNSLLNLVDRETEKYSTQSMAPVPEGEAAAAPEPEESAVAAPSAPTAERADNLTRALLLQDREADLEAWYAERLRSIASPGSRSTKTPDLPPHVKQTTLPPPGLAAAINSARGKVKAEDLSAALLDYETLLTTSAGLVWVVSDMRELIAQSQYQCNPSLHRVLGDALMRQGQLDAALDVYRHALSLL